eukprot:2619611-Rhodomonas_salina.2
MPVPDSEYEPPTTREPAYPRRVLFGGEEGSEERRERRQEEGVRVLRPASSIRYLSTGLRLWAGSSTHYVSTGLRVWYQDRSCQYRTARMSRGGRDPSEVSKRTSGEEEEEERRE